jgi:hypothetical protein
MKFLLIMHTHPCWERLSPEEQKRVFEQHGAFRRELHQKGAFVASYDLEEATEVRTVHRDTRGGFEVTEGPLAGAQDTVGGLYVIEAASTEEAIAWARRGRFIEGANEIRPILDTAA